MSEAFPAGWYAVAIADDIEPGMSAGTRLFGRELVVWRDSDGRSHVWEDRCPHRGMRLSFGFVRGDRIACLYHGWQYDAEGRCRTIPAHPNLDVPDTIRVATYEAAESGGLIFVRSGAEASGEPPDLPDGVAAIRSLYVDRTPEDISAGIASGDYGAAIEVGPAIHAIAAGGADLLLALQPFTAAKTAIHILTTDEDADRIELALWGERLRDALEIRLDC